MIYSKPVSSEIALEYLDKSELLPNKLRSAELSKLPLQLRERAFFSAGVLQLEFLQAAIDRVRSLVSGQSDAATMRLELKKILAELDYQPAQGTAGTLQDLSSDKRLNLILETNVSQARHYGSYQADQDPVILELWPAQELRRVGGTPIAPRPWHQKWVQAGGTLYAGRIIARKNDPIWTRSQATGGFNRFGTPYPPYDFNSGMRLRDIDRDEAIALGVIQPDDPAPEPAPRDFVGAEAISDPDQRAYLQTIWDKEGGANA